MIYLFSVSKESESVHNANMLYGDYFWYNQKIYVFDNVEIFTINTQGYTVDIEIGNPVSPFIEENEKIYHDNIMDKEERNDIISNAILKIIIDNI